MAHGDTNDEYFVSLLRRGGGNVSKREMIPCILPFSF